MSNARIITKAVKAGEVLIKNGAKSSALYIAQAGRFMVHVSRDGIIEFHQAQAPQCLGEDSLFGTSMAAVTTMAVEAGQVIEIPIELAKAQLEKIDPALGAIVKGLAERLRVSSAELKTLKMARGALPCPPDFTAKVFGTIYHAACSVGRKQDDGTIEIKWDEFKNYAIDVMEEDPYRVRQALHIVAKLGYVDLEVEEGSPLVFKDLTQIEAFFEFYQHYHFKGGSASLLKTNEKITAITQAFLKISEKQSADRMGVVRVPFKATIDAMKDVLGASFDVDQLFRLEQKGLLIKRIASHDGGTLSFYRAEFEQMLLNWKVLREVEEWNEKGYVDMQNYVSPKQHAERAAIGRGIAERLAAWQPPALRGHLPTIRTEAQRPNEILCEVCMSTVLENQQICEVCESELKHDAA